MDNMDNPLWDDKLGTEEKLEWLLNELTLDEKLHMLASGSDGVERLGIPGCYLGGEAAHGVEARNDQFRKSDPEYTTSFPQPVGMSSSWDRDAIREAGRIVGVEARVIFNKKRAGGISRWAPTVDLLRDPRWGRNEEAYGEDPVQTGSMASAYIQGIQGDDPEHLTTAATLKHFYANNTEIGRGWKNSSISPRNKYELYLEPFRLCIEEGGAEGVMTAYNRINGVQGLFLEDVKNILKNEFGLTHAVSDGGAMELSAAYSHATAMNSETVAMSVKAGVDAMSGWPAGVYAAAREAYDMGMLDENDINTAIKNVYRTKIRLGLFDKEDRHKNGELCSGKAYDVCKRLTDSSVVLLKNDGLLPLKKADLDKCVLIGPSGDKWYQDWYGGASPEKISLLEGLRKSADRYGNKSEIRYVDGYDRIRLKCGEKYLAIEQDSRIRLSDTPDVFILEDWGEGSYTFRHEKTGKYLITRLLGDAIEGIAAAEEASDASSKITGRVCADTDRIFSWFDLEVFRIGSDNDGNIIISDRFGNNLYADRKGYVVAADGDDEGIERLSLAIETVSNGTDEAVAAAKGAETVILALGCNPMVNAKEEIDRSTIEFIPSQQKLFDEIYKVNNNIVVVLMCNYPYAINVIDENARAIVWSATGSQCMGASLCDVLTGEVRPSGRLTQTWYRSDDDLPDIDDYDIIGKGRTYRYFTGDVLYPFGHGLTYTEFNYDDLNVSLLDPDKTVKCVSPERKSVKIPGQPSCVYDAVRNDNRVLHIETAVTNSGSIDSDEVVQVYAKAPEGGMKKPLKQLIAFEKIRNILPGETRKVVFDVPVRELALYDVAREALTVLGGRYEIMVGPSSRDGGLSSAIDIDGETAGSRDMSGRIKADHYDQENGLQIVQGTYGYNAVMAQGPDVYEPVPDSKFRAVYANCVFPENAKTLRIHGCAPSDASVNVYIDDQAAGSLTFNTREYEKHPSQARNHMPRAAYSEEMRKRSWPVLWTDIQIPLAPESLTGKTPENGHVLRIEVNGPFKYDWFSMI